MLLYNSDTSALGTPAVVAEQSAKTAVSVKQGPLGVTLKQAFPQHFVASRVRPNKVGERRSRRSGVEREARIPISASGVIADGNKSAVDGVGRSGGRRNSINAEDRPTAEVRIDDTRTSLSARGVVFRGRGTCLRSEPVSPRELSFLSASLLRRRR